MRNFVMTGWVVGSAVVLAGLLGMDSSSTTAMPPVKLKGWAAPARFKMRAARDGHILLHPGVPIVTVPGRHGDPAYELDPVALTIVPASEALWQAASGAVHTCDAEGVPDPYRVQLLENHVLKLDGRVVKTYALPRRVVLNHQGDRLAVLSARGPVRRGSLLPFIGPRERLAGPRYHELFSFPSGQPLGKPIALKRDDDPWACWDPDDKVIIYADDLFLKVNVIPARVSGDE